MLKKFREKIVIENKNVSIQFWIHCGPLGFLMVIVNSLIFSSTLRLYQQAVSFLCASFMVTRVGYLSHVGDSSFIIN